MIASLDIGKKKIGVAWADEDTKIIFPGMILDFKDVDLLKKDLSDLAKEKRISKYIVGIPESEKVENENLFQYKIGEKLKEKFEVEYVDESFSTIEAKEMLAEYNIINIDEDVEAAMIILKRYLAK